MRPFEILFIACLSVCIVLSARYPNVTKVRLFARVAIVLTSALQLIFEGFRWQMTFAFMAEGVLLMAIIFSRNIESARYRRLWQLAIALVAISTMLAVLVPVSTLPAPTGQYPVGTQSYLLTDNKRWETFSQTPMHREIMIQVWYPSIRTDGAQTAPYMEPFSDGSPYFSAPLFSLAASHLPLIRTDSTVATPMCQPADPRAVLIFSHGMMGGRIQNTVLAEELASHGYVVVGIDHTFDCSFAILPDRTICSVLLTRSPMPIELLTETGLEVRVKDVCFVLDELARLNLADPKNILTGRLDLHKVGVYGHSLGGQTALLACAQDKRIKAGLSMDGVTTAFNSISQPFMLMQAAREGDPLHVKALRKQLAGPNYILTLKNSGHANFTDLPLLTPVHWITQLTGSIDGLRATQIIDDYALAFFDQYIRGKNSALLKNTTPFPEVELSSQLVPMALERSCPALSALLEMVPPVE